MTDAMANERRGAVRVGRLASRTLFVLGGAVAGTAAAWLISDAGASADTLTVGTSSVTPVTDATVGGLGEATQAVSRFSGDAAGEAVAATCPQDATTWSLPQHAPGHPVCASLARGQVGGPARQHDDARAMEHEVSGRVSDQVTDLAQDAVLDPAKHTLGAAEHIARQPQDTRKVLGDTITPPSGTPDVWQLIDPAGHTDDLLPLPALPGMPVQQTPVTDAVGQTTENVETPAAGISPALRQALSYDSVGQHLGMPAVDHSSRGDRHHGGLPVPLDPAQLPAAPASVPSAPGAPVAPGGHLDGLNMGVPTWVADAVDNAVTTAGRLSLRHTPPSPGAQPGVTPD